MRSSEGNAFHTTSSMHSMNMMNTMNSSFLGSSHVNGVTSMESMTSPQSVEEGGRAQRKSEPVRDSESKQAEDQGSGAGESSDEIEALRKELEEAKLTLQQAQDESRDGTNELEGKLEDLNEIIFETKAKNMNLQKQVMKLTTERQNLLEKINQSEATIGQLRSERTKRNELADRLKVKIEALEKKMIQSKATKVTHQQNEQLLQQLRSRMNDVEARNHALVASMKQLKARLR